MKNLLLSLVQDTLELIHQESSVLASPDEAAFFRKQKLPAIPITPIAPAPAPAPIRAAPKLPEPAATPPPPAPAPSSPPAPPTLRTPPSSFGIKEIIRKAMPRLHIIDTPPDDTKAKSLKEAWKTANRVAPISTLIFGEPKEHQEFLKEFTLALHVHFDTAKVIEAESLEAKDQWEPFLDSEQLKFVIMCDATLWQLPRLRSLYKEIPSQQARYLKAKPLFLLPDLSLYLKDIHLKKSLWAQICQLL